MATLWKNAAGQLVRDGAGKLIDCPTCPCGPLGAWYCAFRDHVGTGSVRAGTGSYPRPCIPMFLTAADLADPEVFVCGGPYADYKTAYLNCVPGTGTGSVPVEDVLTACCPDDPLPEVLWLVFTGVTVPNISDLTTTVTEDITEALEGLSIPLFYSPVSGGWATRSVVTDIGHPFDGYDPRDPLVRVTYTVDAGHGPTTTVYELFFAASLLCVPGSPSYWQFTGGVWQRVQGDVNNGSSPTQSDFLDATADPSWSAWPGPADCDGHPYLLKFSPGTFYFDGAVSGTWTVLDYNPGGGYVPDLNITYTPLIVF